MSKHTVYIGLGSNIGDRVAALRRAVERVRLVVQVVKVSNLYVAAPLGYVRDDAFVNCVLCGKTNLPPYDLLKALQEIEQSMGRQPGVQYGPRPIDLDILFYDTAQIETTLLTVPHPGIPQRAFVLKPLAEIAPRLMHPVLYYTIDQLLQDADDVSQVQLFVPKS
jgi:2-amino-4-hydroxy-6-hydroxymethyldihydropteridine diphosphokinase